MSTTLKFRRGNTAVATTVVGAQGELFVNTDANTVAVHDGVTAGGWPAMPNSLASGIEFDSVAEILTVQGDVIATSSLIGNILIAENTITSTEQSPDGYGLTPITVDAPLTVEGTITANALIVNGLTVTGGPATVGLDTNKSFAVGGGLTCSVTEQVTGANNIGVGYRALKNTCGWGANNTAFGYRALYGNLGGCNNFAVGYRALQCNGYGNNNIALGRCSLTNNNNGSSNIAVGPYTLQCNRSCSQSVAIGANALRFSSYGSTNTAIGFNSMLQAGWGGNNVGIGAYTLYNIGGGHHNTAVGINSNKWGCYGCYNVTIGAFSAYGSRWGGGLCGRNNVAVGSFAGCYLKGASYNVAIGNHSMALSTFSYHNVALGTCSLQNTTSGGCNVAIGKAALQCNSTCYGSIAIGAYAAQHSCASYTVAIGNNSQACNYGGLFNTSVGSFSLQCTNCGCNTSVGFKSLHYTTYGGGNTALGTCAGSSNGGGCNNTFIGFGACGIGSNCSNTITLGNNSIATIRAQVTSITALSDARDKTDIEALPIGLEFLRQVRPVKFTWNMRDGSKVGVKEGGFIAQELKQLSEDANVTDWLELVISNEDGSRLEATPGKLLPVIIKAIQDLAAQNDALTAQNTDLVARVTALENK